MASFRNAPRGTTSQRAAWHAEQTAQEFKRFMLPHIAKWDEHKNPMGNLVKVTAYNSTTGLYTVKPQLLTAGVLSDIEQVLLAYDWAYVDGKATTAFQRIPTGTLANLISAFNGYVIEELSLKPFAVLCFPTNTGDEGSGAGDGTDDTIGYDCYDVLDTGKTRILGSDLVPLKPRHPGCEYWRPDDVDTAGSVGIAYWDTSSGSLILVLMEVIEERPMFAIRVDESSSEYPLGRVVLEGGETTASGSRYIELDESDKVSCTEPT